MNLVVLVVQDVIVPSTLQLEVSVLREIIMAKKKEKTTVIDYTLEQYFEEKKRAEKITETLEKMASVMEKFESMLILHDHRIKKLEKKNGKK